MPHQRTVLLTGRAGGVLKAVMVRVWVTALTLSFAFLSLGQPAPEPPSRQYADSAEYDLFAQVRREADPTRRLALLRQWQDRYPQSAFRQERFHLTLTTQQALGLGREMLRTAEAMAADDPLGLGNYWISSLTVSLQDSSPAALARGERGARALLRNLDATFALTHKPMAVSAAAWRGERDRVETVARRALGWIALARGNHADAQRELSAVLARTPNDAEASYWTAVSLLPRPAGVEPSSALYHLARALSVSGPGALTPASRDQVRRTLDKLYQASCGNQEGVDSLLERARTSPFPAATLKTVCQAAR